MAIGLVRARLTPAFNAVRPSLQRLGSHNRSIQLLSGTKQPTEIFKRVVSPQIHMRSMSSYGPSSRGTGLDLRIVGLGLTFGWGIVLGHEEVEGDLQQEEAKLAEIKGFIRETERDISEDSIETDDVDLIKFRELRSESLATLKEMENKFQSKIIVHRIIG